MFEKFVGFGKSFSQGTKNFGETVSLNTKIEECKKEIKNCFCQLGEMYYMQNLQNVPEKYAAIFDHITSLNQTIIQCQEQIKVLKGVRKCPNCGADVAGNVMFCGNCGFSVPVAEKVSGKRCPGCGSAIDADAVFCTNCGMKLPLMEPLTPAKPAPAESAAPVSATPTSPLYENPEAFDPVVEEMPSPVAEEMPSSVAEEMPSPVAEEIPSPVAKEMPSPVCQTPEQSKFCYNCGTKLEANDAFCYNCGTKLQ